MAKCLLHWVTMCKCRYKTSADPKAWNKHKWCFSTSIPFRHIQRNMIIQILALEGCQRCRSVASTTLWTLYKWLQLWLRINFKVHLSIQSNRCNPITGNNNSWTEMEHHAFRTLLQGTFRALLQDTFKALLQGTFRALRQGTFTAALINTTR